MRRYTIANIPVGLEEDDASVRRRLAAGLGIEPERISECVCVRRAIDARRKTNIHFVCAYEIVLNPEPTGPLPHYAGQAIRPIERSRLDPERPEIFTRRLAKPIDVIIVGAGPAGLFAALALAESGASVTLLERGKPVETRMRDIGRLRSRGELNSESNICFGEGGAGTYTDGKLYTRIKHPYLRWVLATFVRFGADPDILIDAHPHLGTDKLVRIVRNMRHELIRLGVDYRFEHRVDDLIIQNGAVAGVRCANGDDFRARHVILAIGHSARDTYQRLQALGIHLEPKGFAVGLRAEHPQALINEAQHGRLAGHPALGAAEYTLKHQAPDAHLGSRGVYTFCMCPGGLIVPSATEPGHMAINGMSNAKRRARFANAGVVVQVTPEDIARHGIPRSPLMGMFFQRQLEQRIFTAAGNSYQAPAMRITDFIANKASGALAASSFKPGIVAADLQALLPAWITKPLRAGLRAFDRRLRGYISDEANLLAGETRTSSPVRIPRRPDMQSVNISGLYPVGEGAGYAGGIVSAAVDGLKAAEAIIRQSGGDPKA